MEQSLQGPHGQRIQTTEFDQESHKTTHNTSRRRENLFPELPYFNSPNVQFSTKNIKYMQKIKRI